MELRVIGCHGGETPRHRTCAFVIDDTLAIDAGSLTSGMELDAQVRLTTCLVSHAHLDHVRDLATLADNRCQMRAPPLIVAGTAATLETLRRHFFNNVLWPDFSQIPAGSGNTIEYVELSPEKPMELAGKTVRAVLVDHTIEASSFIIEGRDGAIGYSGDTGPTNRMWEVLNAQPDLRALLMEVSFPNREQRLATVSGHHTPQTLAQDMAKYKAPRDLPTLLYHIKPAFQSEVERECAALPGLNLQVLQIGDHFVL
ncbi:CAMP phosphodiesterases class-II:Metallo-beta-lactamase superfamily protein [Minicystis rosea]|nr:CAMP phosphodiesterases class-II:Metallo-beta-lactamase superfamily protein [Minicystis rosea]